MFYGVLFRPDTLLPLVVLEFSERVAAHLLEIELSGQEAAAELDIVRKAPIRAQ